MINREHGLKVFKYHVKEAAKNWKMAEGAGGRQSDSPAGRHHEEQALEAFRSLSEEEKAQLPPEMRREYKEYDLQAQAIEQM